MSDVEESIRINAEDYEDDSGDSEINFSRNLRVN